MRKLIITEWMSLDGIFDASSMNKWWTPFDSHSRQQYIQDTINKCDIMLYGRKTYEMLYPYWSSFNHNEQGVADRLNQCRKFVVSSRLKKGDWGNTTVLGTDFPQVVRELKKEDGDYILVQGSSSLIKPLFDAGLVDELRLLINPAIIGTGERLFKQGIDDSLKCIRLEKLEADVVLAVYSSSSTV